MNHILKGHLPHRVLLKTFEFILKTHVYEVYLKSMSISHLHTYLR